ncbi:MAG: tetratricopeptide repeat protein, partial [Candidatus Glassbacteria bacterium]|nr:tetratricopeptide repeat protein [Candidatus Glassbacteria bacterium]
ACFQSALESRSLHSSPVLIDADLYYRMGELEKAAREYELVLRTHRSDEVACQMLGIINHRLGKPAAAKNFYLRYLEMNPRHFETVYNLALLESEEGNTGAAEKYFNRAIELDSTSAAANFQLARLLRQSGETGRAVEHLKLVLETNPDDVQAHEALAELFFQDSAHHAEALKHFQILARLQPERADYLESTYIRPLQAELSGPSGKQP